MAQQDWKSANERDAHLGGAPRLVTAPSAGLGVSNALRGAFACSKDVPDDFDLLLARLR